MALSNRINARGGNGGSAFAWVGSLQQWNPRFDYIDIASNTTSSNVTVAKTPVLPTGCSLYYDLSAYYTYGKTGTMQFKVEISADGSNWVEAFTSPIYSVGGAHPETGNRSYHDRNRCCSSYVPRNGNKGS